ncbi:bifunctional metallophosphatase/5'-nucleotidase [Cytobacillus spongiae]|uniref:bifunctional metallophosphatase/5'-nucleotidase n=1 Tax=Cytobacillus spongiae TaxID=2901381 RepID=UPI001F340BF3|nr:bifunctional UDP-sugar hydrolase/5'-nucleotidase [Cytobacillus spongiae]UII55431.1 bifunctional metallophosphatase/5'-nucleotidase [Cytobacillus spongiae]
METIHIYHTNDLHSHFNHWPRIHQFLLDRRTLHEEVDDEVFLFDIGDHMDRWHPYSDAFLGKGNVNLLNEAGYTAATIGNNEGITLSYEGLDEMYESANFDVLLANLYYKNGTRPNWAKPYKVYETCKGTRMAIIGLTAYFSRFYELLGWSMTDPIKELESLLGSLEGQADAIILLSHLGIHEDERIAEMFPEIDVILGGHTHHILHEGKQVEDTLLCGGGKHGQYVGHVTLTIDSLTKEIKQKKAILYDTNQLPSSENELEYREMLFQLGKDQLGKVVTELSISLDKRYIAAELCSALQSWTKADASFLNEGLILGGLQEGPLSKYDLLMICPHPINPCLVELTGAELKEVLLQTLDEKWEHLQVKGLGFRGTVMGKIVHHSISFEVQSGIKKVLVNGVELKKEEKYKLAIPDMFTFGRFFPEIFRAKTKQYFLPEFMRDLLAWKLANGESS